MKHPVLFELSALGSPYKTGIPNYVLSLARAIARRTPVAGFIAHGRVFTPDQTADFLNFRSELFDRAAADRDKSRIGPRDFKTAFRSKATTALRLGKAFAYAKANRVIRPWRHSRAEALVTQLGARVQHMPSHVADGAFALPLVATMHDLTTISHPEAHESANIGAFARYLDRLTEHAQRFPLRIATVSDFSRRELTRLVGGPLAAAARTTPLGYDRALFSPNENVRREDFLLSVGTLEPRKNLTALLAAFEKVGRKHPSLRLKLAGARGWKHESLEERLAKHPFRDRIEILGFVSDTELADLYRRCALFCYPSLFEGFGLPPLEAMACGAPIALSNASSLPEVGGDAALYFDPRDIDALAVALERGLDERATLSKKSIERASLFGWDQTAEATLKLYDELLSSR